MIVSRDSARDNFPHEKGGLSFDPLARVNLLAGLRFLH